MTRREGLHRPAWSCGECRRYWFEWRRGNGYSAGVVRGPGQFEQWADRLDWVMHDRRGGAVVAGDGRPWPDAGRRAGCLGRESYVGLLRRP